MRSFDLLASNMEAASLPGWSWAEIQQFVLVRSFTALCGRDSPGSTPGEDSFDWGLKRDSCIGSLARAPGPTEGALSASMHAFNIDHVPSMHERYSISGLVVEYVVAIGVAWVRFPAVALS